MSFFLGFGNMQKSDRRALDTSWKIWNELWRWLAYPKMRLIFVWHGISWGEGWRIYGVPIIQKHRRSRMSFGPGLQLRSSVRSNPGGTNHPVMLATLQEKARLEIGANFSMSGGSLAVTESIVIGNHVTVGLNTVIMDSDFHPLTPDQRGLSPNAGRSAAVLIEDDVFIGLNCLVLKGVTIGRGSVIGAGSVVTKDVPAGVIAAGNPARVVRELNPEPALSSSMAGEA
jgi:acetyltransferase-like isoleucine patch superfamily enzyme